MRHNRSGISSPYFIRSRNSEERTAIAGMQDGRLVTKIEPGLTTGQGDGKRPLGTKPKAETVVPEQLDAPATEQIEDSSMIQSEPEALPPRNYAAIHAMAGSPIRRIINESD